MENVADKVKDVVEEISETVAEVAAEVVEVAVESSAGNLNTLNLADFESKFSMTS